MKKINCLLIFLYVILTGCIDEYPIHSVSINIQEAGTLTTLLSKKDKAKTTNLTITGFIDARDILCMQKECIRLTNLDISQVHILGFDGAIGNNSKRYSYPANEMPSGSFHDDLVSIFRTKASTIKTISLPLSLHSIGSYSFYNCSSLISIKIPDSVVKIGNSAFAGCGELSNLIIGNSVTLIEAMAFNSCVKLTKIIIPVSVKSIGDNAFANCTNMTNLEVSTENLNYSSLSGCLFNKKQDTLIQYPIGKRGDYIIPKTVTSINNCAFQYCKGLTNISIPNSVTYIGTESFQYCENLQSVILPNSITSTQTRSFLGCVSLNNVTIPNSVTSIGVECFGACRSLQSISIPSSVTSIGDYAFGDCNLSSINVQSIIPLDLSKMNNPIFAYVKTENCVLYVPKGAKSAYQTALYWRDFKNIIEK